MLKNVVNMLADIGNFARQSHNLYNATHVLVFDWEGGRLFFLQVVEGNKAVFRTDNQSLMDIGIDHKCHFFGQVPVMFIIKMSRCLIITQISLPLKLLDIWVHMMLHHIILQSFG